MPNLRLILHELDQVIVNELTQAITDGRYIHTVSADEQELLPLPVRLGGHGISQSLLCVARQNITTRN